MPVSYSDRVGKEWFIIPAPLVSINKSYDTTGDGNIVGSKYSITLTGKLIADRGSPTNLGKFYELADALLDPPYNPSFFSVPLYPISSIHGSDGIFV